MEDERLTGIGVAAQERLDVCDGMTAYAGFDQEWYGARWQRMAGCGPTVAAEQLWYLRGQGSCDKSAAIRVMEESWRYVTPGAMGTHKTSAYVDGARALFAASAIPVQACCLNVPDRADLRPSAEMAIQFVAQGLRADCPVAFLNLHAGGLKDLDDWHWVLVVEIDEETGDAVFLDQGKRFKFNLADWLERSRKGGGFVWWTRP